ncbi:hypothetical protein NGRA_2436 [Nosema granulosis]|uniref:Uncharacterized protein n=1 Tax=Nosema granulosis TaxID=83296 RepID=A0A9P6GXP2_9MICR|nr:hypothetical protein NGRA_2436 [Nosema granulosis]
MDIGKYIKHKVSVHNRHIVFNPLVTEDLGHVILGMDGLGRHGPLLIYIFKDKILDQCGIKTVKAVKKGGYSRGIQRFIPDRNGRYEPMHDRDTFNRHRRSQDDVHSQLKNSPRI